MDDTAGETGRINCRDFPPDSESTMDSGILAEGARRDSSPAACFYCESATTVFWLANRSRTRGLQYIPIVAYLRRDMGRRRQVRRRSAQTSPALTTDSNRWCAGCLAKMARA